MKYSLSKKVSIFITVDEKTINNYFNAHDPAPLYKRQLDQQFEHYILKCAEQAKKYSVVFYKLKCADGADRQYAEPLMYAIRRHFSLLKQNKVAVFQKFKRQNFYLLGIGAILVLFCHSVMPMLLLGKNDFQTGFLTILDIFSWIILLRPIDKLIFNWSAHLKDITLLDKLSSSEMMVVNANHGTAKNSRPALLAISQAG
jgi:hypothetical protein